MSETTLIGIFIVALILYAVCTIILSTGGSAPEPDFDAHGDYAKEDGEASLAKHHINR